MLWVYTVLAGVAWDRPFQREHQDVFWKKWQILSSDFFFWVCVFNEVLRPSWSIRVMLSGSVSLTTLLLGRLSPLSNYPVLCTVFRQKLTTTLFESGEGRGWPKKIFRNQSPVIVPATSWSPVGCASNWATEASSSSEFTKVHNMGIYKSKYFSYFSWKHVVVTH